MAAFYTSTHLRMWVSISRTKETADQEKCVRRPKGGRNKDQIGDNTSPGERIYLPDHTVPVHMEGELKGVVGSGLAEGDLVLVGGTLEFLLRALGMGWGRLHRGRVHRDLQLSLLVNDVGKECRSRHRQLKR